jgi:hypothetical protein
MELFARTYTVHLKEESCHNNATDVVVRFYYLKCSEYVLRKRRKKMPHKSKFNEKVLINMPKA